MIKSTFKHGNQDVPMELGYVLARGKLLDLGIDVLSIMKESSPVIPIIMLDDDTMLKVWWFYLREADIYSSDSEFNEALEVLDQNPKGLEPFKKAFWEMVLGFTSPLLQPSLKDMWKEAEKQLRNALETRSTTSSSPSVQEQD